MATRRCRSPNTNNNKAAHRSLQQATMLAITAFPHTILPNPLIRELGALTTQAGLQLPLVEEGKPSLSVLHWISATSDE